MSSDSESKFEGLKTRLKELGVDNKFALAFSGGLDSRFIAYSAGLAGLYPVLIHAQGPHISARESLFAEQWAARNGLDLLSIVSDPLLIPEVQANGRMRCYHCKRALFSRLKKIAGGMPLCDGTQASDSRSYRPGTAALAEFEILSPLADAGLTKAEIRHLAEASGMDSPDQQARPCLLTRFSYGLSPDHASLEALDKAEKEIEDILREYTKSLAQADSPDFRLRHLGPGKLELHITPPACFKSSLTSWPQALMDSLETAICETTGIPACIRVMSELSGFFDRE